ncbi:MAG: NADH-quinone oxidoreductase subunit N, partial [Actinomycetota bacterium]
STVGHALGIDGFSVFATFTICAGVVLAALLLDGFLRREEMEGAEPYVLVLLSASGGLMMAMANDLIVMFLGLEVLSLAVYVLAAMHLRKVTSQEAGVKYFVLGAFSSAFFLFGVAWAYGATGTTNIVTIAHALAGQFGSQGLALLAFAFLTIGFGFKVAVVPFHQWTPDVYQGAPTPVTAFMSAATKVAAFMALIRVLDVAFQPLTWDWTPVIWVLAAVTVVVGSVLAIAQSDIKRMLAYSSIAHAGFILTGLTSANQVGIRSVLFYLVAYSLMTLGAFGVVMLVSGRGEAWTSLTSYAGLAKRSPVLAGLMTLFLLSLAGIPPTVGFVAKVGVFGAAILAGHWSLAVIGVIASVAAAFFYLRVIVLMYMQEPQGTQEEDRSVLPRIALAIPAILTLVLGIFPGTIMGILERASILRW